MNIIEEKILKKETFFTVSKTTCNDVYRDLIDLKCKKASQYTDISASAVKENATYKADFFSISYNDVIIN